MWANSFYADGGIPPQQGQFIYRQHPRRWLLISQVSLLGANYLVAVVLSKFIITFPPYLPVAKPPS